MLKELRKVQCGSCENVRLEVWPDEAGEVAGIKPQNTLTHFGLTLSKTGSLEWCKQDPILNIRITCISLLHFCVCDLPGQCIGLLALKVVLEWPKKKIFREGDKEYWAADIQNQILQPDNGLERQSLLRKRIFWMSLTFSVIYQEASLTELTLELYLKRRTDRRALISGLEDGGEEVRKNASVGASQVCIFIVYLPVEVPDCKGRGALWEEMPLHITLKVFTSLHKVNCSVVRHRASLNLTFSSPPWFPCSVRMMAAGL